MCVGRACSTRANTQTRTNKQTHEQARTELEGQSAEGSTNEAVSFLMQLQELKKQIPDWAEEMGTYSTGQRLLERQVTP